MLPWKPSDGIENSVMSFCLGNNSIVGQEYGIFLPITRRLHPKICSYILIHFINHNLNLTKTIKIDN